jgi:TetR/AcrR family transcriptional regulator
MSVNASNPIRRTQERAIATQQAILRAAFDEFARVGFTGASLRKIADTAEVNHRLINHHFGSKLDLWKATAAYAFIDFYDRLEKRLQGLDGVSESETIRLMFREFILHAASEPALNKFMLQANDEPERMRWLVDTYINPTNPESDRAKRRQNYVDAIQRAQALDIFVPGNPQFLWYIFAGAATSIFAYHEEIEQVTGVDPFDESLVAEHVDTVLALFFRS